MMGDPGTFFSMSAEQQLEDLRQRRARDAMSEASDAAILAAHFPDADVRLADKTWSAKAPDGERLYATGPAGLAWQLIKATHRPDTGT